MAWQLQGTYFENCTCDGACPCTASSLLWPANKDHCDVIFAFHVDSGEVDGTSVDDLTVVVLFHSPQALITDGNLKVGLYVDDRASDEQVGKLGAVFGGELGGPMVALAPLIAENAGLEKAPISYADDGVLHRVTVGDAVEVEIEDLVAPEQTEPTRYTPVTHPAASAVTVASARTSRVKGFGLEFEGKAASSAPFSWSG